LAHNNQKGNIAMFKHILCPIDLKGKGRAKLALKKAVQIAHQFGAKITVLNIHPEFMQSEERQMLRVSVEKMESKFRKIALESKQEMQAIIAKLLTEDIEVDYLLRQGKPEKTISNVAGELGVDLIVICTDGRDNLKDFVTGTVTENVINSLVSTVLVIPSPQ